MSDKNEIDLTKVDLSNLTVVWERFGLLVKYLAGDVKLNTDGTLQHQIDMLKENGIVTVDTTLSDTSANPVQNKAIKAFLDAIIDGSKTVGNADKFAGLSQSHYLRRYGLNSINIDNTDGNWETDISVDKNGENSLGTRPTNTWYKIIQFDAHDFKFQLAGLIASNNTTISKLYIRQKWISSSSWSDWRNVSDGGNAATAQTLKTARNLLVDLASTAKASFDGSADKNLGITGTLPITNGGTGATTAAAARSNLGITPANIGAVPTDEKSKYNFINKNLNVINIDTTFDFNYVAAISEDGHGTRPPNTGWVNVVNFHTDHFITQIAVTSCVGTTTMRPVDMYIRERYKPENNNSWSEWKRILSSSNSIAVAITSTAPSDTTALWVY